MSFLTYICFASGSLFIRDCIKNLIILISVLDLILGSEIEDFIAALKFQSIMPEIALEKNITSLQLHNGAIKISLEGKVNDTFSSFIPYVNRSVSNMSKWGTGKYTEQQRGEYLFDTLNTVSNLVNGNSG